MPDARKETEAAFPSGSSGASHSVEVIDMLRRAILSRKLFAMLHPWNYKTAFTLPNRLVGIRVAQHVPFAFALVELHKPRLLVELGTYTGLSYCAFCQAVAGLNLPTKCYGVDTWKGDAHTGAYDENIYSELSTLITTDIIQDSPV